MDASLQVPDDFNATAFIIDKNVSRLKSDKVAIYYQDQKISYRDLQREINKVGNGLKRLGIEIENRIAILLHDCPEWVACFFGAIKIGAVPVALNTMMVPQDYQYFLKDSRAKAIVVSHNLVQKIESIKDKLDYLKHMIVVGEAGENHFTYQNLVNGASSELKAADTCKDDVAFWQYTSGSTGLPKGVMHLHHDLLYLPEYFLRKTIGVNESDIFLSVPRLFFNYGLMTMVGVFYNRAAVVLDPEKPMPERIFEIINKHRPSILSGVPTFYGGMLALANDAHRYTLGSVRECISGGEPLPLPIFKEFKERFGLEILEGIGSTESADWYILSRPGRVKPGSTGEAVQESEVKLVDEELREVPRGEIGEALVKSKSTALGYWNKHEMTKKAFIGEWLRTGDLFCQDEEGYFWFKGRVDETIKTGGIKVIPIEVERAIEQHPAVAECAVVGAEDEQGLVKPKAFVVLKSGYKPAPELVHAIQKFVKTSMAPYNYPRWIEFIEELPRTATGKIQRFKLREFP